MVKFVDKPITVDEYEFNDLNICNRVEILFEIILACEDEIIGNYTLGNLNDGSVFFKAAVLPRNLQIKQFSGNILNISDYPILIKNPHLLAEYISGWKDSKLYLRQLIGEINGIVYHPILHEFYVVSYSYSENKFTIQRKVERQFSELLFISNFIEEHLITPSLSFKSSFLNL